jgi:hypothetical protein
VNTNEVKAVSTGDVRTSADWKKLLYPDSVITDPDGWDRRDFEYSFHQEKISKDEFERRYCESTVYSNLDHLPR